MTWAWAKRLQTLAHIQVEKDAGRLTHPALVIAPVSLMGNWEREAARFCPGLRCLVLHGAGRHAVSRMQSPSTTWSSPRTRCCSATASAGCKARWHLVVLDEAQNIKNANTHAAQVAGAVAGRHRLCLSGTPMENNLGELWSLFHFLMPGFLGSQKRFARAVSQTHRETGRAPSATRQLRARVTPFMLRRTKVAGGARAAAQDRNRDARSSYQANRPTCTKPFAWAWKRPCAKHCNTKGPGASSQITILDALLKLRQVCCDPQLVLKLEAAQKGAPVRPSSTQLMEMLPEMLAEGRRILLFSQFTSMLSLIEVPSLSKRKPAMGQAHRSEPETRRASSTSSPAARCRCS